MTYKLFKYGFDYENTGVCYLHPNSTRKSYFPMDPDNSDYRQYLEWLAEGNEPLPADEPPAAE
jgi:hypothetical protein